MSVLWLSYFAILPKIPQIARVNNRPWAMDLHIYTYIYIYFFFLEGIISRERRTIIFTGLRHGLGSNHQIPAPTLKHRKEAAGRKEKIKGEKKQWYSLFHPLFLSIMQMVSVSIQGLCWLLAQLQSVQVESCRGENCQQLLPAPLTCSSHSLSVKWLEGGFCCDFFIFFSFSHSEKS